MPSSNSLQRPAEWPLQDSARYRASLVFLVLLWLACIPVGFGFAAIGKASAVKYVVLVAVLFLCAAAFNFITRIRPQHRESDIALTSDSGHPATEIRYSRDQFVLLATMTACLAGLCAFASWDFVSEGDEVPAAPIAAGLAGLAAAFFLSFFALVGVGRLRRGRIVLSQRGIRQEGRAFTSFLPWAALAGAKAAYNGTPEVLVVAYANAQWEKQQLSNVWKLDKLPPVPMIEIDTLPLAVDETVIYHLLQFYLENPTARAELGTENSLRRARSQTFEY